MKTFFLCTMIGIFLLTLTIALQAQQTVAVSGGNATGAGGSVSYTVGQVVYNANGGTTGSVAQGVQQPFEIFVVTGLEEARGITLEISVYPNPAADFLKLKVAIYKPDNLSYQLYDIKDSLLQKGKIVNNETVIPTGNFLPASYLLQVSDNQKEVKTFKIIKN